MSAEKRINSELAAECEALKAERDALAVENAALKKFGDKLNEMHNDLNGEGTGIQGRAEVVCQQAAIEAAMDEFDAITTPATDAALAAIRLEAKIEGANELAERIAEMHSKTAPGSNIEKKLMFAAEAAIAYANGLLEAK